ncbi:sex hormone-binding globulin [Paroedura picta]|uniref:sex hormone-binding globulin n=1 Tax=Paroedura picta TaxID=143630 RepID=UPI004056A921
MPGRLLLRLQLLLLALGASLGSQYDQCFPEIPKEAGALNIGQKWADPSPAATLSIDLRKVNSTASSFEFRTFDPEGVIFYGDMSPGKDWFVLGLHQGKLEMQIHNSIINTSALGEQRIDDGQWHQILVKNEGDRVALELDGSSLLSLNEVSHAITEHPFPEMRIGVGGLLIPTKELIIPIHPAMDGCLREWNWLNTSSTWREGAALEGEGAKACFPHIQRGSFFSGGGLASFLLSELPSGLSLSKENWTLAVRASLSASPQRGTILAVSPLDQAPVLSLKLEDEEVVAQLGDKTALWVPLPWVGCPASDLLLDITPTDLTLQLGSLEVSRQIQETDFKRLRHLWLSGDGQLFIGGLPGQGDPPQAVEGAFLRGCLHEIQVQGRALDLDSAHYKSDTIWAHSCPRNETLHLQSSAGGAELGCTVPIPTTPAASPLPS